MKSKALFVLLMAMATTSGAQSLSEANEFIENFQFEKALTVLSSLTDSSNVRIPLQTGYCHLKLGNYSAAIMNYKKALMIDSVNRVALNQLGQLYARSNQFTYAEDCFTQLIKIDSTNSFYFKQYASLLSSVKNDSLASIYYRKAVQLNARDMDAYTSLATIFLEAEQFEPLDSLLQQALTVDSLNTSVLLLKAKSLMAQSKYKEVIATVEKILAKNDTQPIHIRLLGISYFQLDQFEKSKQCMEYLLKTGMKNDWIYYYLGICYRELNDLPQSIDYLNKAVEEGISENISLYYSQLARSFEDKKDYKNAIHYYLAAYEQSKTKILLYHLARNYDVYFKDKSTAIAYYRRYLSSDDTIKLAREYSKRRLSVLE
jgi:tetratricopeptide (TPR) repeat protein